VNTVIPFHEFRKQCGINGGIMSENRYTRLKAIKEFGYDINWEELNQYHVGIVGVGGLGCVSSEMTVRSGVGKVSLFDFDKVEMVNLNRSMFKESHIGKYKVDIAKQVLEEINPEVEIGVNNRDIMDPSFESTFESKITSMDIILNGLDNIPAREYLNIKCISLNIPYMDAGASRSGLSGYVHPIIPGKTSCAKCLSRIGFSLPDERAEPCVASLPSTMAILASIQFQEMIKYLLDFGQLIDYLMYDMVSGKFLDYKTKRDEDCPICGRSSQKSNKKIESKVSKKELDDFIDKIEKNSES